MQFIEIKIKNSSGTLFVLYILRCFFKIRNFL